MKKFNMIMIKFDAINSRLNYIGHAIDKNEELKRARDCLESQLKVKQSLIDTIVKERNQLQAENEALRNDSHILEGRLRHLLQSATVRLFDEKDLSGDYVRDIKRLDTYGVHYKMREYEANGGPKNAKEREAQKRQRFQEGDVLTGPNRTLISFPDGNNIKVKNPDGSYYLITRDGLEMVSPDGKRLKVN